MIRLWFLIFTCLTPAYLLAQNKKPDSVFCDCEKAKSIQIKGNTRVGPVMSPKGAGKSEISTTRNGPMSFDEEHHSAWYKLLAAADGTLSMEIIPLKEEDDYDFMLFKSAGKNFCDSLSGYELKPLRACLSRNKSKPPFITGMKLTAKKETVKKGPGEQFVKSIEVKKGEVYYLVLDNVHDDGGGFTLSFFFEGIVNISGIVKDENNVPLKASISLVGPAGDTVQQAVSNSSGFFRLESVIRKGTVYTLNFSNDKTFFDSREVTLNTPKDTLKNLSVVLPHLKKGGKYTIRNINFYPGVSVLLPSGAVMTNNLYRLMKKNESLKILIVGHVNGCSSDTFGQGLSERRAATVKNYLVKRGINGDRMSTEGRNCAEMLFPNPVAEWQASLNRRVEIKVLEFKQP
jgi:outer membrane protein OmpA-like peptidoglycan-associated protein